MRLGPALLPAKSLLEMLASAITLPYDRMYNVGMLVWLTPKGGGGQQMVGRMGVYTGFCKT